MLDQLVDVGQQLALAFNKEGSVLAAGGEVQTVPSPFLFDSNTFVIHYVSLYVTVLYYRLFLDMTSMSDAKFSFLQK